MLHMIVFGLFFVLFVGFLLFYFILALDSKTVCLM